MSNAKQSSKSQILWILFEIWILTFGFLRPYPVYAQEASLLITSHTIRITQQLRGEGEEQQTFFYGISEEMVIENRGVETYKGPLSFWLGVEKEDEDEIRIQAAWEDGSNKSLEFTLDEEGVLRAKLGEEPPVEAGKKIRVGLTYREFFVYQGKKEEWEKRILYPHAPQSLQIKVNPTESAGFRFKSSGFELVKSRTEEGWYESPLLSPQVGETYLVATTKEEIKEKQPEEKPPKETNELGTLYFPTVKEKKEQPPEQPTIANPWLILLINNIFIIGLAGLGFWWFNIRKKQK